MNTVLNVVHMSTLRLKSRRTAGSLHSILTPQESGPCPRRKWYVTHFPFQKLGITDREQDNYYPLPIRITPENFEVLEESDGNTIELKSAPSSPSRSPTPCRFKHSHLASRMSQGKLG